MQEEKGKKEEKEGEQGELSLWLFSLSGGPLPMVVLFLSRTFSRTLTGIFSTI